MKIKSTLNKFSSKGFTLIELLIVIAVIGVLAAGVLVAIDPAAKIKSAKNSNVKSDMGQIVNALQAYYTGAGNQLYPVAGNGAAAGLGALVPGELKVLPNQQASFVACAASPNGGNTSYANSYCYTTNATGTIAAIWGSTFTTGALVWCWDSTNGVYKAAALATSVPTQASPTCL